MLVRSELLKVGSRTCPVRYFELNTARGLRRFSAEILLAANDRIILDDDSLANLDARIARLLPATLHSRSFTRLPAA
jgi:hypothetical protein